MDTISPWASQIEEKKPFFLDFSEQETIKKIYNEIERSIFQHKTSEGNWFGQNTLHDSSLSLLIPNFQQGMLQQMLLLC